MPTLPTPQDAATDGTWGTQLNDAIESLHLSGAHADRPTSDLVEGTLYACSDDNALERWDGAAWSTYLAAGGGGGVTWTKVVDHDPMTVENTARWVVQSGTWIYNSPYGGGIEQTGYGVENGYVSYMGGSFPDLRAIEMTVRLREGATVLGAGFQSAGGGWGSGGMAIGLDLNAGRVWYDRYGSGGNFVPYTVLPDTDYKLQVMEMVKSSTFRVFVDGVFVVDFVRPGDVNVGGVGIYCRYGIGSVRDVTVWDGRTAASKPLQS